MLEQIKRWFRRTADAVESGEPVATPPPGTSPAGAADTERETSTNAQTEGAAGEPWPGDT
jgi:hypothetical protein